MHHDSHACAASQRLVSDEVEGRVYRNRDHNHAAYGMVSQARRIESCQVGQEAHLHTCVPQRWLARRYVLRRHDGGLGNSGSTKEAPPMRHVITVKGALLPLVLCYCTLTNWRAWLGSRDRAWQVGTGRVMYDVMEVNSVGDQSKSDPQISGDGSTHKPDITCEDTQQPNTRPFRLMFLASCAVQVDRRRGRYGGDWVCRCVA